MDSHYTIPTVDGNPGHPGINYDETQYGYDLNGRPEWTEIPDGTITWNVLDARGLTISTWVGTDNVPFTTMTVSTGIDVNDFRHWLSDNPSDRYRPRRTDMVRVASYLYNADGNAPRRRNMAMTNPLLIKYGYDWRERQVWSMTMANAGTDQTYTFNNYDNLDRIVEIRHLNTTDANDLTTLYNSTIRPPATFSSATRKPIMTALAAFTARSLTLLLAVLVMAPLLPTPGTMPPVTSSSSRKPIRQNFTKTVYDGLGLPTVQYFGYDSTGENTSNLYDPTTGSVTLDLSDDTILTQTVYIYDEAGHVTFVTTRQRNTGVDESVYGALTTGISSATCVTYCYDAAGHVIKQQADDSLNFIKTVYDGFGRLKVQYDGSDADGENPDDLYDAQGKATLDLSDDTILTQSEYVYDTAGNITFSITRQRNAGVGAYGSVDRF